MMDQLEFFIPGEPKAKQRPRFNAETKNAFTTQQDLNYEAYARAFIYYMWDTGGIVKWGRDEPLFLFCTSIHTPSKANESKLEALLGMLWPTKKPDFDNVAKIVADAMNKIVYPDDAQIVGSLLFKRYVNPGEIPGVKVKLVSRYAVPLGLLDFML